MPSSGSQAGPAGSRLWHHAGGVLALDRCRVMAIVNVTPDSFSDGGRWLGEQGVDLAALVEQCRRWIEDGAAILDVGGESTRPGAEPVAVSAERDRVLPVIEALCGDPSLAAAMVGGEVAISVDTRRAAVAREALAAGATIVNDVSTLADPEMAKVVAEAGAGLVISHLRGEPETMQDHVAFSDLLAEIGDELAAAVDRAVAAGVGRERILVDPGIGFGKTARQSAALVASSAALAERSGCAVLIGASRKRFLAAIGSRGASAGERTLASVTAAVLAAAHGAAVVRVHDVAATAEALEVGAAIELEWTRAREGHFEPKV